MSTSILPDGSVVVRLASHTVHLDVRTKAIHLRAAMPRDELSGSILESFPRTAVDRVRILREHDHLHHLYLELRSGRALDLGQAQSHELAMMTARVVADLTRCKIEVSQGVHKLPGASEAFSAAQTLDQKMEALGLKPSKSRGKVVTSPATDPFEAPTGRIPYTQPIRVVDSVAEAPTLPPGTALDEDPLEMTACRPASREEVELRQAPVPRSASHVDISDLVVPPRRVADLEVDETELNI